MLRNQPAYVLLSTCLWWTIGLRLWSHASNYWATGTTQPPTEKSAVVRKRPAKNATPCDLTSFRRCARIGPVTTQEPLTETGLLGVDTILTRPPKPTLRDRYQLMPGLSHNRRPSPALGSSPGSLDSSDESDSARPSQPLQDHTEWVNCIAFSPDGARIAWGSFGGTILPWDAKTGAAIGESHMTGSTPSHSHQTVHRWLWAQLTKEFWL